MNKRHIYLLLAYCFLLHLIVYAQQNIDEQIDSLVKKTGSFMSSDLDSASFYADKVYGLASQSSYKKGKANAALLKGAVSQFRSEYESAIKLYTESLEWFAEIDSTRFVARMYLNIANIHNDQGNYEQMTEYALKAVAIFDELGDTNGQGRVYNLMGAAARARNDYPQAIAYFRQYSEKVSGGSDTIDIANSYNNIGTTFQSMGQSDSAIHYLLMAENLFLKTGARNISDVYQNLGVLYEEQNQLEEATKYNRKSLESAKATGNRLREAGTYHNLGKILQRQHRWDEALANYEQALSIAREIGFVEGLYRTNNQIAETKAAQGKYIEAYQHQLESGIYRDSLYSIEKTKATQELQAQYETEKKEQQIEILSQESAIQQLKLHQRGLLLIGTVILLSALALLIYFVQNRRKIRAEARLQREAAQEVLQAEERERRRIAGDLHDGVGQMLSAALLNLSDARDKFPEDSTARSSVERALSLLGESYDEMRSISHQMMPNALLKAGLASSVREFVEKVDSPKLKVSLDIVGLHQRLDEQTETVLYRIIQESVSNVVKHAEASKLSIQLIQDREGIDLTIEDNGTGFDKAKLADGDGIGLRNIQSRVALLNGTLDIDTSQGKGTLLAIHIPVG